MKTSFVIISPDTIELQMTITAPTKTWDALMRALPRNNPECLRLHEEIVKMLNSNRVSSLAIDKQRL